MVEGSRDAITISARPTPLGTRVQAAARLQAMVRRLFRAATGSDREGSAAVGDRRKATQISACQFRKPGSPPSFDVLLVATQFRMWRRWYGLIPMSDDETAATRTAVSRFAGGARPRGSGARSIGSLRGSRCGPRGRRISPATSWTGPSSWMNARSFQPRITLSTCRLFPVPNTGCPNGLNNKSVCAIPDLITFVDIHRGYIVSRKRAKLAAKGGR